MNNELDTNTCWYAADCVPEMNRAYDQAKATEVAGHLGVFAELLRSTDLKNVSILDLGCGTALLSEFCQGFKYTGSDLPHILGGAAMRNYPNLYYRSCDLVQDDLPWINEFEIVVLNAVIDIMQFPLQVLSKVLTNAGQYVIIHRQEITEKSKTRIGPGPNYGRQPAFHSIINRQEFLNLVDAHHFDVVQELGLPFTNWENGGASFLLRRRKSFSLNKIDYKLYDLFTGKSNGVFIEAGANDGLKQSNTYYFEFYKNWTGILVEPITSVWMTCRKNRTPRNYVVNAALVGPQYPDKNIDMIFTPECSGLLSVVNDHNAERLMQRANERGVPTQVPAMTMTDILNRYFEDRIILPIDLFVLDIEGYELEALKGMDFTKYQIDYLLIEELEENAIISDYLAPWYYRAGQLSDHDYLYKRK
jgi:FkbM family methyltransferase